MNRETMRKVTEKIYHRDTEDTKGDFLCVFSVVKYGNEWMLKLGNIVDPVLGVI